MISDGTEIDLVDVLIQVGIFACFVVFAICIWLLKRQKDKRKKPRGQNPTPPEISKD